MLTVIIHDSILLAVKLNHTSEIFGGGPMVNSQSSLTYMFSKYWLLPSIPRFTVGVRAHDEGRQLDITEEGSPIAPVS